MEIRRWRLAVALFVIVVLCNLQAASRTGSWGDQGDGTYKNPILNADYPDVDIEQVGDTYYMMIFNNNGKVTEGPAVQEDVIHYRTQNDGNQAFYEYSADGETFRRFGKPFRLEFGRWRGDRLGLYCWNDKQAKGYVDIDYFHYDYDGPKRH